MSVSLLFDIGHPAHFHLFKNFMKYLKGKNIKFIVTSREKEMTNILLEHEGFEFISLSKPGKSLFLMGAELIKRDWHLIRLNRKHKFTHAFGTSVSIAHLTALSKVISYNFSEDDDGVIPLQSAITYPFTSKIINPECINFNKWKHKRVLVSSYHELAYLHPENFSPDKEILKKYGLKEKEYIILRLSALKAHHDAGMKGISFEMVQKIKNELVNFNVIESSELKKTYQVEPWDMHHLLAFSKMLISDSQTMTIEAAVLGIPSLRINTFIGKSTVIEELEKRYELTFGFFPSEEVKIISALNELLANPEIDSEWQKRRLKMLDQKVDFNQWMINFFESEINV